jgi:hypothetical protein
VTRGPRWCRGRPPPLHGSGGRGGEGRQPVAVEVEEDEALQPPDALRHCPQMVAARRQVREKLQVPDGGWKGLQPENPVEGVSKGDDV